MNKLVMDPVCGMEVDPKSSKNVREYKGAIYYFCSGRCLNDFNENPERYMSIGGRRHSPGGTAANVEAVV